MLAPETIETVNLCFTLCLMMSHGLTEMAKNDQWILNNVTLLFSQNQVFHLNHKGELMKDWLKDYKHHFIKYYFNENPDYAFRAFHVLIGLQVFSVVIIFWNA